MLEKYRKPPEPMPLGEIVDAASAEIWQQCMASDSPFAPGADEPLLLGDRALTQVYAIWQGENLPRAVRQRAVVVLTAPTGQALPYDAPKLGHNRGVLNLTPDHNVGFTAIFEAQVFLQGVNRERINELAQGILFWHSQHREDGDLGAYEGPILRLIPYVDEVIADRLFDCYPLPEPSAYHKGGIDIYRYIEALCIDPGIPEKYKHQALEDWFSAVRRENYHPYGEATRRLVELLHTDVIDEGVDLGPNVRNKIFVFLGAFGPASRIDSSTI